MNHQRKPRTGEGSLHALFDTDTMKSKTPRTDALEREMGDGWGGAIEPLALCRELERENARMLAAIRETVESWGRHWQTGMKMQPDQFPAAIRALRDILANFAPKSRAEEVENLKHELNKWHQELSAVMPRDFKDWWENDKAEWPTVAAEVIRNLRAREGMAWEQAEKLLKQEHWE